MPRELTNLEINSFLQRHPDIAADVAEFQGPVDAAVTVASQLAYPAPGLAVLDPSGRYVLVWRDASLRWHYIDLSDMREMQSIAAETNAPPYISDPAYLDAIHEFIDQGVHVVIPGLEAIAVIVVGFLLLKLVK